MRVDGLVVDSRGWSWTFSALRQKQHSRTNQGLEFRALPQSGWLDILNLPYWVRDTTWSILERKRPRCHQTGETKSTDRELEFSDLLGRERREAQTVKAGAQPFRAQFVRDQIARDQLARLWFGVCGLRYGVGCFGFGVRV